MRGTKAVLKDGRVVFIRNTDPETMNILIRLRIAGEEIGEIYEGFLNGKELDVPFREIEEVLP